MTQDDNRIPRGEVKPLDRMRDKFAAEDAATMAWRILYCRPGSERRVLEMLTERNVESYAPKETIWRGLGAKRKRTDRLLIPRYLFVHIPDSAIPTCAHLDGVSKMIGDQTGPGVAPAKFIDELKAAEGEGKFNRTGRPQKTIGCGDRIRVARGRFRGLIGRMVGMTNKRRAEVMLTFVQGGEEGSVNVLFAELELEAA